MLPYDYFFPQKNQQKTGVNGMADYCVHCRFCTAGNHPC